MRQFNLLDNLLMIIIASFHPIFWAQCEYHKENPGRDLMWVERMIEGWGFVPSGTICFIPGFHSTHILFLKEHFCKSVIKRNEVTCKSRDCYTTFAMTKYINL